jgi:uncharacterized protein YecE (DUF72 family)
VTATPERPPRIGTAGWAIPRAVAHAFPPRGSGLQRYAAQFSAVEVNSTFYRSHRSSTYARWAAVMPPDFRFAVKLPRSITHDRRLVDTAPLIDAFRREALQLGDKLGPLLVQLPPSLGYDPGVCSRFLSELRERWPEAIALEPRHPTWFEAAVDTFLADHRIARVAADPARHPAAGMPGGWTGLSYWRLHGSPRMYYSAYDEATLEGLARAFARAEGVIWCVFDNTTSGAAAANALRLQRLISA